MEEPNFTPDENLRRIVCAANWCIYGDEISVILGPRHWDSTMHHQYDQGGYLLPEHAWIQGFIDNFGKLHTREEALVIARRKNQVVRELDYETELLYSEMLY